MCWKKGRGGSDFWMDGRGDEAETSLLKSSPNMARILHDGRTYHPYEYESEEEFEEMRRRG